MQPFRIGTEAVAPGTRRTIDLPVGVMPNHLPVTVPVHVVHGRRPGPVLFVSAAVHGDEVTGIEIARRLIAAPALRGLAGTLMVVPIVNPLGFLNRSRYLPDRRDLNRSFPGSANGSMASRLAHLFFTEVVRRADFGIDLHSAAVYRTNLPQIRVSPSTPETERLALAFGAPIVLRAGLREGSLRKEAKKIGVDMLLYEAGEALRLDARAETLGMAGILRVMSAMGMISGRGVPKAGVPLEVARSYWLRAGAGGLMRCLVAPGARVAAGTVLGRVSAPLGGPESEVIAPAAGIVIGQITSPVVNEGDAAFHIADLPDSVVAEADTLPDEDEII